MRHPVELECMAYSSKVPKNVQLYPLDLFIAVAKTFRWQSVNILLVCVIERLMEQNFCCKVDSKLLSFIFLAKILAKKHIFAITTEELK